MGDDKSAQDTQIIDMWPVMTFRKAGAKARHLRFAQPEQDAYSSGLLAEPESGKDHQIIGSGA